MTRISVLVSKYVVDFPFGSETPCANKPPILLQYCLFLNLNCFSFVIFDDP